MSDLAHAARMFAKHGVGMTVFVAEQPFENDAWKFMEFAQQDLQDTSERGRVNALGNAKRAVDNRVDTLLFGLGLRPHARKERWNYPTKTAVLRDAGVFVPEALQDLVTSTRNGMEHEYLIPKPGKDLRNSVQVAELFVRSTDPRVAQGNCRWVTCGMPAGVDHSSLRVADLPPGSFGILMDRAKETLSIHDGANADVFPLLEARPTQLGELFRVIYASFLPGKSRSIGPMQENAFAAVYL